ncbi:class I SAM-dependent methyltransferase [Thiorhodovibrio litoralis]|uniref:class I SAM-dependent methyltransferase n=1 Tax=Thiorhodovibrio litoralis TaxID=2952932 RepID=UPI002B25B7AA|nr:class I SAM-dependent methyltransferase [Thiorhodovibrio litoralis]WPL14166.1 hypothetical protein Thiosp_03999 [Thiorhodovibrio litoralis]
MTNHVDKVSAREMVSQRLRQFRQALKSYRETYKMNCRFFLDINAPLVPEEALHGAKVFPNREALLWKVAAVSRMPIIAEVGTDRGDWAEFLLDTLNPTLLHLFDIDFTKVRENLLKSPQVVFHQGDSSSNLGKLPSESFDLIYIDGDHSYSGVAKDIEMAVEKLQQKGCLIFNDYTLWSPTSAIAYGVVRAVNELLLTEWHMTGIALTPNGYWDVMCQRQGESVWSALRNGN